MKGVLVLFTILAGIGFFVIGTIFLADGATISLNARTIFQQQYAATATLTGAVFWLIAVVLEGLAAYVVLNHKSTSPKPVNSSAKASMWGVATMLAIAGIISYTTSSPNTVTPAKIDVYRAPISHVPATAIKSKIDADDIIRRAKAAAKNHR
jgi:hypothetical protein